MRYFREPNGDYLAAGPRLTDCGAPRHFECRATYFKGRPDTVVTIPVPQNYLSKCDRVLKSDIPTDWLEFLTTKETTLCE